MEEVEHLTLGDDDVGSVFVSGTNTRNRRTSISNGSAHQEVCIITVSRETV